MKRIIILILILLAAIIAMAYYYFASLNKERSDNNTALYAATADAAMVFSFQQDRSVLEVLKGGSLLSNIIGAQKTRELQSLQEYLLNLPLLTQATDRQNIYISVFPGSEKTVDFLYSTQVLNGTEDGTILNALRSAGLKVLQSDSVSVVSLPDSTKFYLSLRNNLTLLSASKKIVTDALRHGQPEANEFAEHIATTGRLQKNSLAEVYINFSRLPSLLKSFVAGNLGGELSVFERQEGYATLVYNYSKEKILFTGTLQINTQHSYEALFVNEPPGSLNMANLLPGNTANYTAYRIGNYGVWKKLLEQHRGKTDVKAASLRKRINESYRIDPDLIFPKYFNGQMLRFQLSTGEKLGAINLTNGEKLEQLLLDLSGSYSEEIRIFKEEGLPEAYFGKVFANFNRPYFTVKDNYLVFANNASTLQSFLNSYENNRLLINDAEYANTANQLPTTASIVSYVNLKNSSSILLKNIYLPYFRHLNDSTGLKDYSALTCQLYSDRKKFQVNLLMSKKTTLKADSL